jgi:hypothetical protein
MKKKVIIERVPSSKKKVVIEGLPKAQAGLNMPKKKDERWDKQWEDYSKKPNSVANPLQTKGNDDTYYSGADPYVENPKYSDSKPVKNKKGLKNKKNVNWDFSNSNFGLFPLSGGKYAQRGFSYLNQIPGQVENAVSIFKTGKPTEKKQYPIYNPYVNAYWNYAEGGYLPKAQWGDEWGTSPGFGATQQSYSSAPENLQPVNVPMADYQTEQNATITPSAPELNEGMQQINFGESPDKKQKALETIQKAGAVAAPVVSALGAGYNFAKQGLLDVGSTNINNEEKLREAQYTAEAVRNKAMETMPQDYIFNRNALPSTAYGGYAADGMQIKQIGGMGEPNVEVEGEEHIQLPNGFSQEIQGKKHSEGGIPINLPQGTKIFSEKLKVPVSFLKEAIALDPENQMLKSLKLPKTGKVSYADLAKKFETKKYVDLLNSKDADAIQMTTAQLMIQQNNAKLEELFGLQEQNKISGVHGPQVQQNAQQEQQEQEAQQAQMQGEQMEQPMMKYGGYHLPKAQDGNWIKKILNFESTQGSASGKGLSNYGIKKEKWASKYPKMWEDNKITEQEAIDFINKEFLPKVKDYPEEVQKRLVDYAYNTGRNIEDVLLLASGKTDLNSVQNKNTDFNLFNKEKANIIKNMSDPSFLNKIDNAKSAIMQDYWKTQGTPEVYNATSAPRINMWNTQQNQNTPIANSRGTDYGGIGIKPVSFKTPEGSVTELGLNINNAIPDWRSRDLTKWDKAYGFDPGYIQSLANDPIVAKRYGALPGKDPVAALYQEYMYDYHLDRLDPKQNFTPEEREKSKQALQKMWQPTGSTRYGLSKGIKGKNIDFDKAGYEEYNKLRTSFIDGIGKYRYLEPNEQSAATSTTTPKTEETPPPAPTPPTPDQVINQTYEVPGLNLGIALPNVYERMPLNYYKIEPDYIDPRYLDIQPQLNRIGRGQRAIESTLGSRGSSDMANLLQAQANRSAAEQEAYGQKYNYDRAQDAAAQQFNAQAKMNTNQYNQGSWFQQLEDPIRRRESLIGTQQMMDDQAAIENARKMQAFYGNKDYIGDTFFPYQKMTMQDLLGNLDAGKFFKQYQTDAVKQSKASKDDEEKTEVKRYGGKIKKKIKIKPKLKNSYF